MKELKDTGEYPIINRHYPTTQRKPMKRWVIAMNSSQYRQKKVHNENIEAAYMRVLNIAKKVLIRPGTIYFEKDSRQDRDSATDMHTFITPDFYWHLQCNFHYQYEIEFAVDNCTYEDKIRYLLKAYPLDSDAKEVVLQPSFESFFDGVLFTQDDAHIHTL